LNERRAHTGFDDVSAESPDDPGALPLGFDDRVNDGLEITRREDGR